MVGSWIGGSLRDSDSSHTVLVVCRVVFLLIFFALAIYNVEVKKRAPTGPQQVRGNKEDGLVLSSSKYFGQDTPFPARG